jgi:hypothetical protein
MLILLTFAPYFISKASKSLYSDKFIARNWFAVVFPAVLTLYMVLVDGMDVLQADITKYVILWAIIQGIIFSLTESAQKIIFRKGDWQLEVNTRKKENNALNNKENGSSTNK